jgi:hypothetical protein
MQIAASTSHPTAWILILLPLCGVIIGGVITVLGQWIIERRRHRSQSEFDKRTERRDAYVEFLAALNRGLELGRELRQTTENQELLERRLKDLQDVTTRELEPSEPDPSSVEIIQEEVDQIRSATKKAAIAIESFRLGAYEFLREMDRGLSLIHLLSIRSVLDEAVTARDRLNRYFRGEVDRDTMTRAYQGFVSAARNDLGYGSDI